METIKVWSIKLLMKGDISNWIIEHFESIFKTRDFLRKNQKYYSVIFSFE
jgi:hypothetical protein